MKPCLALLCATLITSPVSAAFASDLTLGDIEAQFSAPYNDAHEDGNHILGETRVLLEQISYELNKPVAEDISPPVAASSTEAEAGNLSEIEPEAAPVKKQPELSVSTEYDLSMNCGDLSQEAMYMRDVIYATQDVKNSAKLQSHGITAAGAIGSFLIGSVTGGVGLALGGFLIEQNIGAMENNADDIQDIAEQRRTLMMGIYNAKGCEGPLEHAMQNPDIFDPLGQLASADTFSPDDESNSYNR